MPRPHGYDLAVAPSREQIKQWQSQIVPYDGLKGRFDKGAWAAAGQTDPAVFKWPRALLFVALTIAGLGVLVALGWAEITALIGGGLGVFVLVMRAHHLHRCYVEGRAGGSAR